MRTPCYCDERVYVTGREAKQLERPRNHKCPRCGREFRVAFDNPGRHARPKVVES
jgi:hypothetical protein